MALEAAQPMLEAAYRQETMQLRDQMNVLRERDAENRTMLTALRDAERQRHEGVMEEQGQQRLAGMEERIRQSQERIDKKAGGGAGGGAALPGGVGTHLLQHESGTFAFNERSGKAWKFNDETQKYEPISPNQIPKDARKFGASLSLASAQRMNLVKAGASNAIRMLDEIQKNYGDASTTSVFFGQSAENPLTRGLYGAGRGQMSAKQQKVDAAWAGFIDEAIPVFTGGLRGSDAFRRFLIEQAPAPGDKPATVKEKMRIIRNNIQGTNKAFFNKFVSDSKMWAEGTKPEEIEQAREAMKDRGEATEPSIDDLVKKYGQ
jgi:hypothetical protein